ncbi:MAG: PQQ-dependent sugar dehydrogenase [Pseudomonadota bacterium]
MKALFNSPLNAFRYLAMALLVPFSLALKADDHIAATKVATDIQIPWGMVQLTDGQLLVTERTGTLYRVDTDSGKSTKISGIPKIKSTRQGGFLDLELHPDYAKNGWIYMSYTSPEGEGDGNNTTISRAKLKDDALVDVEMLYRTSPNSERPFHYGSRLEFDNDGYLYFTVGDRGQRDEFPQDTTVDAGKVYRIHDDGRIPKDNPFVDGAKPAIFSYGHRNPQGMALNPETGSIWVNEHGPKGGDEINVIAKGLNYGWPVISYGVNYSGTKFTDITEKEGMEQPAHQWTPSMAPSGMVFVTSDKYPEWQGKALVGSLKFAYIELVTYDGDTVTKVEKVMEGIGRVRNIRQMADGYIYVGLDGQGVVRLEPQS